MTYFTKDFTKYLKDLKKNNNREWFHENKKRYESSVKKPFNEFIQAVIDAVGADDPNVMISPKEAIFRINRDIRFSPDKTPYKTQMSAIVSPGGRKDKSTPGLYLQFSEEDASIYSGLYMLDKHQLQNVREFIVTNLKEFDKLIKNKKFVDTFGEIRGEKNKRIPKEFREIAEKQPLIANKQFYFFTTFDQKLLMDPKLVNSIMQYYKVSKPLSQFFAAALKGV